MPCQLLACIASAALLSPLSPSPESFQRRILERPLYCTAHPRGALGRLLYCTAIPEMILGQLPYGTAGGMRIGP